MMSFYWNYFNCDSSVSASLEIVAIAYEFPSLRLNLLKLKIPHFDALHFWLETLDFVDLNDDINSVIQVGFHNLPDTVRRQRINTPSSFHYYIK